MELFQLLSLPSFVSSFLPSLPSSPTDPERTNFPCKEGSPFRSSVSLVCDCNIEFRIRRVQSYYFSSTQLYGMTWQAISFARCDGRTIFLRVALFQDVRFGLALPCRAHFSSKIGSVELVMACREICSTEYHVAPCGQVLLL